MPFSVFQRGLFETNIFDVKLGFSLSAPIVVLKLIADVEHLLTADPTIILTKLKPDGRIGVGALRRYDGELEVV